jgi:hypothetical protein
MNYDISFACFTKATMSMKVKTLSFVLDYSIKGPLVPSISPGFYGWTD